MILSLIPSIFLFVFLNEFFIVLFEGNQLLKIIPIIFLYSSIAFLMVYIKRNYNERYNINFYFRLIFGLLIFWSLFTIIRSINTNPKDLITLFTHYRVGGLDWITPLALFLGLNILNWIKIYPLLRKFLVVGMIFALIHTLTNVHLSAFTLLSVFSVLMLTSFLNTKRFNFIVFISMIVYISYSFGFQSNRSSLIIITLAVIFFLIEYLRNKDNDYYKRIFTFLILSALTVVASIQINSFYEKVSSNKELTTDTRTFLLVEMFNDMNTSEKIIGRGALGTYYSDYFYLLKESGIENGDDENRSTNEIGYLHMILKGGYIMVVLNLLLLIPAAYLGIFKSNNSLVRMSGYYILTVVLLSTLIYPPEYKLSFFILWMCVGTCLSYSIRRMSNNDIKNYFKREGVL